jgi:solute:Na+ symporter, SSS family
MHIQVISAFIAYFSLLLLVGVFFHKKQVSSADFIMGNRSLNFWLVALSAHASDMSAWLFMAFPESILVLGTPQAWIALGLIIGMFCNWHFVAPRLRTMTEKYNCYTLSSFFEKRFKDKSGTLRLVSAIVMVIFLTYYLSAGLIAMGFLLESIFGINYYLGLTLALLIVIIYTLIGGFTTVAWTDLFQGLFLLVMILIVPLIAFSKIQGWDQIATLAEQKSIPLSPLQDMSLNSFITYFLLALGWGLGYFGMPHVITKFMGINSVSEMYKSKWLGISWQIITLAAATSVGLIAIAFFPQGLDKPEMVFVEMVKSLFHPFIGGFILCAVIAANMSTMDSQILVAGSILSEDLYKHFLGRNSSDQSVLWSSRISVILVAIIALLLSFNKSKTIMDTVGYAWSGLGSAFGPLVLMSLYSKTANKKGALAGIITGGLSVMIWPSINSIFTSYKIMPMIPGFFLSLSAIYLISKWTSKNTASPVAETH